MFFKVIEKYKFVRVNVNQHIMYFPPILLNIGYYNLVYIYKFLFHSRVSSAIKYTSIIKFKSSLQNSITT